MKIGITDGPYIGRYGVEKGFEKMAEHGYGTIDWNCFIDTSCTLLNESGRAFEKDLLNMKNAAEKAGIEICQTHGPWDYPYDHSTPEARERLFAYMKKSIEGCAILGCPNVVIHYLMPTGDIDRDIDEAKEINFEFFSRLAEVGGEYGVTVCLENMPFIGQGLARPKEIVSFVRSVGHTNLRVCLDTGHANIFHIRPGDAVREIGKDLLYALHVHDNNGRQDAHDLPGTGTVDWEDFRSSLTEIGFEGSVSLECGVRNLPTGSAVRETAERSLAAVAKHLASLLGTDPADLSSASVFPDKILKTTK